MPLVIPKLVIPTVPLFTKKETEEEKEKRKEQMKNSWPPCFRYTDDLESDYERDRESGNQRDRESDYERYRACYELVSRFEHDKEGGGGAEADIEEDKDKEKEKEKEEEKRKKKGKYYHSIDLYLRMYFERVAFLFGEITFRNATFIGAWIGHCYRKKNYIFRTRGPKKDIFIFINSKGGALMGGVALHDSIKDVPGDIHTVCVGNAFSIAALVLAAGKKEKRTAGAAANIMLHEASVTSLKKDADVLCYDMLVLRRMVNSVIDAFVKITGQSKETIKNDLKSDKLMSAEEAQIYGIIDCIVDKKNYKDGVKRLIKKKYKLKKYKLKKENQFKNDYFDYYLSKSKKSK